MNIIDRLDFAKSICQGMRVLDIGGALMPGTDMNHPFARKYKEIEKTAKEYRVIDCQEIPNVVHYVIDFNKKESAESLKQIIDDYKPDIILCMEFLEHVNYHTEVMDELAYAIETYGTAVFISLPNNGNWINNILNWHKYHIMAFFKNVAKRFICQSSLGKFEVQQIPCIGQYYWWWRIFYVCSFFQPMSWGFLFQKKGIRVLNAVWPVVNN